MMQEKHKTKNYFKERNKRDYANCVSGNNNCIVTISRNINNDACWK